MDNTNNLLLQKTLADAIVADDSSVSGEKTNSVNSKTRKSTSANKESQNVASNLDLARKRAEEIALNRKERGYQPDGINQRLKIKNKQAGFSYRFVNADQIDKRKNMDYEIDGEPIAVGGGMFATQMRIPTVIAEQDRLALRRKNDRLFEGINNGKISHAATNQTTNQIESHSIDTSSYNVKLDLNREQIFLNN